MPFDNTTHKKASPQLPASWRSALRRVVAGALHHTGLLYGVQRFARTHTIDLSTTSSRLRRVNGARYGILCYHRVGTEGVPVFSRLAPAAFEAQMSYLRRHYRIVSLTQLCSELKDSPGNVRPTLAITFDDGYRDLYNFALPVLQSYQIPATIYLIGRSMETGEAPWYDRIFVAMQFFADAELELELDTPRRFPLDSPSARAEAAWQVVCYLRTLPDEQRNKWCSTFGRMMRIPEKPLRDRMLTWEQVHKMQRAGIDFGAHTMTHPAVSRLDDHGRQRELFDSKRLLEAGANTEMQHFAYPFGRLGDINEASQAALARAGYRSAVTTMEGTNAPGCDRLSLHRFQIGDDTSLSMFAFNVTRLFLESREDATELLAAETTESQEAGSPSSAGRV